MTQNTFHTLMSVGTQADRDRMALVMTAVICQELATGHRRYSRHLPSVAALRQFYGITARTYAQAADQLATLAYEGR